MCQYRKLSIIAIWTIAIFIAACKPHSEQNTKSTATSNPAKPLKTETQRGEQLYKHYCASCHPDGGNVSDPKNNLRKSTLKAKRITKPEDIIKIMRKPVSRMISFDESVLSNEDARAIAEYVLEAF
jgi:cytochrome c6